MRDGGNVEGGKEEQQCSRVFEGAGAAAAGEERGGLARRPAREEEEVSTV